MGVSGPESEGFSSQSESRNGVKEVPTSIVRVTETRTSDHSLPTAVHDYRDTTRCTHSAVEFRDPRNGLSPSLRVSSHPPTLNGTSSDLSDLHGPPDITPVWKGPQTSCFVLVRPNKKTPSNPFTCSYIPSHDILPQTLTPGRSYR